MTLHVVECKAGEDDTAIANEVRDKEKDILLVGVGCEIYRGFGVHHADVGVPPSSGLAAPVGGR